MAEFSSLIDRLCLGSSLRLFTTDMLLHDARLTEASRDLRHMLSQQQRLEKEGSMEVDTSPSFSNLELCLKLASVNYALNNFSVSCRLSNLYISLIKSNKVISYTYRLLNRIKSFLILGAVPQARLCQLCPQQFLSELRLSNA